VILHPIRSSEIKGFEGGSMLVILFRSKLTSEAGQDYNDMNHELENLVRDNPGFIDVKSFKAEDGERLTVVWWKDRESLEQWRNLPRHREAQATGRQKWYEYYKMEVATVERVTEFDRHSRTVPAKDQSPRPRAVEIDSPA
jgi:heme-degrading monooxygenase HmoA